MSTEARTAPSGGRESVESLPPQPYPPHFYPPANYQGPPQPPWFPGHPPAVSTGPWPAPWGYAGPAPAWSAAQAGGKTTSTTSTSAMPSDEYTVDTMRRIYNDDDGRVEIQRVKVQRRHPEVSGASFPTGSDAMSLVPVGSFPLNERRPPPRKNKIKRQMQLMQSLQGQQGSYPWYPYMPCMPYPYPYPYYYGGGCMWPPGIVSPPMTPWPGSDDSERTTSRQESLPTTLDSQRLESRISAPSRNSLSPSPSAATHSIAPSDSVSIFEYKDEESLKLSLRGPTPPPRSKSRASIERRARALMAPSDAASDAGDKLSVITTSTDIVPYQKLPPKRKNRASKAVSISDKSSTIDQKDIDSLSDRISVTSDMTCDEPSRLSSELNYAFRKFERSVDAFKTKLSDESTPVNTPPQSPPPVIVHSSDSATVTENETNLPQSENSILRNDSDSNVNKSSKLMDSQLLSDSLTSLPQLETAPSESLSSPVASAQLAEIPPIQNVPVPVDLKQEQNLVTVNGSINVPQSSAPDVFIAAETADSTTNASDIQQAPVSAPAQEVSASSTVTAKAGTQDSQTTSVSMQSEQITTSESQAPKSQSESVISNSDLSRKQETQMDVAPSSGRDSRASSSTFFSLRPSDDPLHLDTDSTDILLPTTDATTADEGGEGTDWTASSPVAEDNESYQWVLQQPGEIPDLDCSGADREDERRNAWRAEVSLWRARLVVSLCRGRGLDRQDWATFHLLVHHPLTLDLKLSMLHAPRLCVANSTTGAALVRVALIHLAQHGETLLQPEASRQHGWKSIKVDPNQSWAPVKGAVEILKALGYREREDGVLRYPRRSGPEVSVLARLTLDMLVLAEELRLYLTGTHQYPTNISDLFFPASAVAPSPLDGSQLTQDIPRPPSSTGSYSFRSAQSNTSLNDRPESRASSVTDDDTETLQASVRQAKSHAKKPKQPSSSEEEVTLKEEIVNKQTALPEANVTNQDSVKKTEEKLPPPANNAFTKDNALPSLGSTVSLPVSPLLDIQSNSMSSLPDLQSVKSSTISLINQPLKASGSNDSVTPVATPTPDKEETKDNPEDHIYEEIDVIRQQVQALRASSVPVDTAPPPLPPKKKVSSGEDDSGLSLTYPHMEWTSSSMPGSLRGGSAGARKKKRRAPMPPDFMPKDWRPYENRPEETPTAGNTRDSPAGENKANANDKQSLNPFYEDIDSVKAQVKELNKSSEKQQTDKSAKGNDGRNPFIQEDFVVSGYVGKNPFYEDIDDVDAEMQRNKSNSAAPSPSVEGSNICAMGSLSELQDESILLKTKRRAPKPPSTPDPSNRSSTQSPRPPSSPQPPKHPPKVPPPRPPSAPPPKSPSSPRPPKSPSSPRPPTSPSSPPPPPLHPPTTPPPNPPVHQPGGTDSHKQQASSSEKADTEDKSTSRDQDTSSKPNETQLPVGTDQKQQPEAQQTVSKTNKVSQQRLSLQHPTIPPPPPPPKLEDDEETPIIPKDTVLNSTTSQNTTQSLLDDIPYMDANEIYPEKTNVAKPEPPQYEIPELPGKDGIPVAPPLSPATMRQTALLLSGRRSVPFIDDSDLPPDCPPPPPPTSPPASPPETPHVSPPETPHTSPPETPCGSPPSSPITVSQVVDTSPQESSGDHSQTPTTVVYLKTENINQSKEEELQNPSTSKEGHMVKDSIKTESENPTSSKAEDTQDAPPLPPKTLQSPKSSQASKTKPEPSKTVEAESMQSSMSEDRYEIPDTSLSPPESSGTTDDTTVKTEAGIESPEDKEEAAKPEVPPPEVAEERYEIPEVVKETALSIGPEGMPIRIGGPMPSNRMNLESVFGPPKPPNRRRRNHSLPPPRPPKSSVLDDNGVPKLPPKAATTGRSASSSTTTSIFTTASSLMTRSPAGTPLSFLSTPKPLYSKPKSKTRRSWPLLFCDCMYANCRNYDDMQKK